MRRFHRERCLSPPYGATRLAWLPYPQVAGHVSHLAIPDLGLFLEGYVEGWIPDGWITLVSLGVRQLHNRAPYLPGWAAPLGRQRLHALTASPRHTASRALHHVTRPRPLGIPPGRSAMALHAIEIIVTRAVGFLELVAAQHSSGFALGASPGKTRLAVLVTAKDERRAVRKVWKRLQEALPIDVL